MWSFCSAPSRNHERASALSRRAHRQLRAPALASSRPRARTRPASSTTPASGPSRTTPSAKSSPSRNRSACRASPTASSAAAAGRPASSTRSKASACATARSAFERERRAWASPPRPTQRRRCNRKHRIVADDYRFLKIVVKRGIPKVTIAAPDVMHWFLGPKAFETHVYRDREAFFADLVRLYQDEIAELAHEGCTYLQLDDTALPCNCDPNARNDVRPRRGSGRAHPALRGADQRVRSPKQAEGHDGRHPSVPRQPQRRLDGGGRLRARRRGAFQPARRRHLLPGIRHRARRATSRRCAIVPKGKTRDTRPRVSTKTP